MSARDDYPPKRYDQAQARQWEQMCDEIDRLRTEIDEARQVFDVRMDRIEAWMAAHGYGLPQVIA